MQNSKTADKMNPKTAGKTSRSSGSSTENHSKTVIMMQDVRKIYKMGETEVHALRGISFSIENGEFVSIMGPSGSGKSTCMNMIGCLDRPTSGIVKIGGKETAKMSEKELASLRNKTIGFVFQQYHLLPGMTVLENVMLPLRYQGIDKNERAKLARAALERVEMGNRINHRPNELSGGQKQRVAIARAMVTNPDIILADEPTGALDSKTGLQVLKLFREINQAGTTIVIVTHDPGIGASTNRCIRIFDGSIHSDLTQEPVLPFTEEGASAASATETPADTTSAPEEKSANPGTTSAPANEEGGQNV